MSKAFPTIGCCRIDCGLCPRFYTSGTSNAETASDGDVKSKAKALKASLVKYAEIEGRRWNYIDEQIQTHRHDRRYSPDYKKIN
ncbi:MAG: hypothetical protein LBT88_05150 [Oscillospiraceae bacterium]|nr:hypothetical protein [Oscillospiraceae bacterium]